MRGPVEPNITEFQRACLRALSDALQGHSLNLPEVSIEGVSEFYLQLVDSNYKAWIYEDGAEIQDVKGRKHFEATDYPSSTELIHEFVTEILNFRSSAPLLPQQQIVGDPDT